MIENMMQDINYVVLLFNNDKQYAMKHLVSFLAALMLLACTPDNHNPMTPPSMEFPGNGGFGPGWWN